MEPITSAVEDAIQVVASRDAVFYDTGARKWASSIPGKAPIRTHFGESHTVTKDQEGNFVDASFIPKEELDPDAIASGYTETSREKERPAEIDLRGCMLDHSAVTRLSRGLGGNYFVKILSLSGNQLRDSEMSVLAGALVHNGCLTELNLSYNCIATLGSTLLATALTDNRHIRMLDLMHNRIGKDGMHPWLGKTLRTNHVLQELKLTHNDIGTYKANELLVSLAPKIVTDEELLKTQIRHRRRTEMPTTVVAKTLASPQIGKRVPNPDPFNTTLTTLLLANTGISDEAAEHIAHVLTENQTLTHLDISSNAFTDTGNKHIAIGLKHNKSLRYLNYSDNRMHEHAGVSVVHALHKHPVITTALFQDCFNGSDVAASIAVLTRTTKTLKALDVSHCALEPPGVVNFYRALGENATIENLEMTCMGVKSDQAVAILAQCLEQNGTLRLVDLSFNEITLRGCKLLRDAAATHGARVFLSLEGNSGEKRALGVTILGGMRPARVSENLFVNR